MVPGAGQRNGCEELAGPFWVCLCLLGGGWGRGCRQQLPPSQLSRPALCQEGRESWHSYCSLVQMPVCLHHSPLRLCLSFSPDPTGVAGWGVGVGWGPGSLGLRVARLYSLWSLAPLFCFTSVPTPIVRCLIFIHQASVKCLCVFSDVFLCYVSGFGVSVSVWPPSP